MMFNKSVLRFTILLLVLFLSCKENSDSKAGFQKVAKVKPISDNGVTFEKVDFSSLNRTLIGRQDDPSPEAIMQLYYPTKVEGGEGNEKLSMTKTEISDVVVEINLLHENLADDSVSAENHTMELKRVGERWMIISLKKSWKCWKGRGHTDWGIGSCD